MKNFFFLSFLLFGVLFLSPTESSSQWIQTYGPYGGYILSLAASGTNLFAGTCGDGVFLSTNNGTEWIAANSGLTNTDVYSLSVSGTNLFAGTGDDGIFLSTNNGTEWTAVNSGLTNPDVYSLAVSGTNLFAGTNGGGVFLSTNNGTSWTAVNTGLTNTCVQAFAISGTNLFAGTCGDGVFLSTNNGTSWTAVNTGLTNICVQAFAISGSNLFAGTYYRGLWWRPMSEIVLPVELTSFTATACATGANLAWTVATELNNYGFEIERRFITNKDLQKENWTKIGFIAGKGTNNSPQRYSYTDNTVSSGKFVYRLKQIDNDGVYKYSSESEVTFSVLNNFALEQNYPNPFNPTTTISFSLPFGAFVSLNVFDALGREVATVVSEELSAGKYLRQWNAMNMPSGIYYYRLEACLLMETKKLVLLK